MITFVGRAAMRQSSFGVIMPRVSARAFAPSQAFLSTSSSRSATFTLQSEEEFQSKVLGSSKPVIVDFKAGWCGPCKMLTPRLDAAVASTEDAVDLAIVDIDDFEELAIEHKVTVVPTVLGIKNGAVVSKFVGLIDDDKLGAFIAELKG